MEDKKTFLRNIIRGIGVNYFSRLIIIPVSLFVAKLLTPTQYGILAVFNLISGYTGYAHLGIFHSLPRQIPFYKGKGETETIRKMRNTSFSVVSFISLIISTGIVFYLIIFHNRHENPLIYTLLTISAILILNNLSGLYKALLRSDLKFNIINQNHFWVSLLTLTITLPLVYRFRLYGVFISGLIISFFGLGHYWIKSKYSLKIMIDLRSLKLLLGIGISLFAVDLIWFFAKTVGRLIVATHLPLSDLGQYQFASNISRLIYLASSNIGSYFLPVYSKRFGETREIGSLRKMFIIPQYVIAYGSAVLIASFLFLGIPLVRIFYLQFVPGIIVLKFLIIGIFFTSIGILPLHIFNAAKKINNNFYMVSGLIIIVSILSLIAVKMGYGINGVAFAYLVASFLFSLVGCIWVVKEMKGSFITGFRQYLWWLIPIIFTTAVYMLFTTSRFIEQITGIRSVLLTGIVQFIVYIILYLPIIWIVEKKKKVFNYIWDIYRKKRNNMENNKNGKSALSDL